MSESTSNGGGPDFKAEAIKNRMRYKSAKEEIEALRQQVAALEAERDEAISTAEEIATAYEDLDEQFQASPSEWQQKAQELQAELAQRDHRDAWKAAIGSDLHEKASVEKLWAELDYQAEGDVPDADAIQELVGKAREAAPYLFKAPSETEGAPAKGSKARVPLTGGVGGERGGPATSSDRFRVRRQDMSDPGWMRKNQSLLSEHAEAGTLDVVD